jgi:hypothetical protein
MKEADGGLRMADRERRLDLLPAGRLGCSAAGKKSDATLRFCLVSCQQPSWPAAQSYPQLLPISS